MYRCELCKAVQAPRTPCIRVTVETRPTEYPSRPKAHKMRVGRKMKTFDDSGGAGYEIAKEAKACPKCAEEFVAKQKAAEAAGIYDDEVASA
jgi:hypothetical protein